MYKEIENKDEPQLCIAIVRQARSRRYSFTDIIKNAFFIAIGEDKRRL